MRGASFLRKPLPTLAQEVVRNEVEAAVALGLCNNPQELVDTWNLFCDGYKGEARARLQEAMTRQLRLLGALQG